MNKSICNFFLASAAETTQGSVAAAGSSKVDLPTSGEESVSSFEECLESCSAELEKTESASTENSDSSEETNSSDNTIEISLPVLTETVLEPLVANLILTEFLESENIVVGDVADEVDDAETEIIEEESEEIISFMSADLESDISTESMATEGDMTLIMEDVSSDEASDTENTSGEIAATVSDPIANDTEIPIDTEATDALSKNTEETISKEANNTENSNSTDASEQSADSEAQVLTANNAQEAAISEEIEEKTQAVARGKGRGKAKGKNHAMQFLRNEKKIPTEGDRSPWEHENPVTKSEESQEVDEILPFGTSFAQQELMNGLAQLWRSTNPSSPELNAMIEERTGLGSVDQLSSVDQLRTNSWKNASDSQSVKTEVTSQAWLKDVPEMIANTLNSANLILPKRIEIPLKTPAGATINLFLQEANGHIRAQLSSNDKLVMEWVNREVVFLKEMQFSTEVRWTPPQFEQQQSQRENGQHSRQQETSQEQKQEERPSSDEETRKFAETLKKMGIV
ncbi:MAG: hypothetical protein ACOY3I_05800 [Verrucomicrobiota bacterium]